MQGDVVLAEPFYLALQMYGYEGDAHDLINHKAMPKVGKGAKTLYEAVQHLAHLDPVLEAAWNKIPKEVLKLLRDPTKYVGLAEEKVLQVCKKAESYLSL